MKGPKIGQHEGVGHMMHAIYCGPDVRLRGRGALVLPRAGVPDRLVAQFNSHKTGLGFGWWSFPWHHFTAYVDYQRSFGLPHGSLDDDPDDYFEP